MELGPLCPRGNSIPYSPSTSQPEIQPDGAVRVPSIIKFLSSCPQYSNIPGMASLHQSHVTACPDDSNLLFQKMPSSRLPLLLYSDYASYLVESSAEISKMVHLTPSCSRSASVPGFPTVLKLEPNMVHLSPTCPRISRIPGLASAGSVTIHEKDIWDRRCLWKKPLKTKRVSVSQMSCAHEQALGDTNMVKLMVAMLPTCSGKASVPGFPSAQLQRMTGLLPTCPSQTMVVGMPFRQRVMADNDNWHISRGLILERPQRSDPVLVQEMSLKDREHIKQMVDMLPTCPWKATIPSFPSLSEKNPSVPSVSLAPSQESSTANLLPICSKNKDLDITEHVVTEKPLSIGEVFNHDISVVGAQDLETIEIFSSVAVLPSGPLKTCMVGMSTGPQKLLPSNVSLLPTCPKQAQTPGMPSLDQNNSKNRDWHETEFAV